MISPNADVKNKSNRSVNTHRSDLSTCSKWLDCFQVDLANVAEEIISTSGCARPAAGPGGFKQKTTAPLSVTNEAIFESAPIQQSTIEGALYLSYDTTSVANSLRNATNFWGSPNVSVDEGLAVIANQPFQENSLDAKVAKLPSTFSLLEGASSASAHSETPKSPNLANTELCIKYGYHSNNNNHDNSTSAMDDSSNKSSDNNSNKTVLSQVTNESILQFPTGKFTVAIIGHNEYETSIKQMFRESSNSGFNMCKGTYVDQLFAEFDQHNSKFIRTHIWEFPGDTKAIMSNHQAAGKTLEWLYAQKALINGHEQWPKAYNEKNNSTMEGESSVLLILNVGVQRRDERHYFADVDKMYIVLCKDAFRHERTSPDSNAHIQCTKFWAGVNIHCQHNFFFDLRQYILHLRQHHATKTKWHDKEGNLLPSGNHTQFHAISFGSQSSYKKKEQYEGIQALFWEEGKNKWQLTPNFN